MNPTAFSELLANISDEYIVSAANPHVKSIRWYQVTSIAAGIVLLIAAAVYPKLRMQMPEVTEPPVMTAVTKAAVTTEPEQTEITGVQTVFTSTETTAAADSVGYTNIESLQKTASSVLSSQTEPAVTDSQVTKPAKPHTTFGTLASSQKQTSEAAILTQFTSTKTEPAATTSFVYRVDTEWGYVPPLGFQSQSEMIDAVRSNDISGKSNDGGGFGGNPADREAAMKAYLDMYARFRDEGFYLQAASTDDVTVRDDVNLYLFPFTPYEDAGIGRSTIFRETGFFVVFFRADPDLTAYTTDIADYLRLRKECGTDRIIQIQDQTISIYRGTDGQLHAAAFADADHYYEVRTMATEEELTEFLSHLSYERINL